MSLNNSSSTSKLTILRNLSKIDWKDKSLRNKLNSIKNKRERRNLNIDSNKQRPERNSKKLMMISKPIKLNSEKKKLKRKEKLVSMLGREIKWLNLEKIRKSRSLLKASRHE